MKGVFCFPSLMIYRIVTINLVRSVYYYRKLAINVYITYITECRILSYN